MVGFDVLQRRLRDLVNERISNGEFTERGFARMLGISQPQVHNVLKGARKLSYPIADKMMARLEISAQELFTEAEIQAAQAKRLAGWIPRKPPVRDFHAQPMYDGRDGVRDRAV